MVRPAARCGQAETERESGSISGSPGRGAISGTLDAVCEQTRSVASAVAASIAHTEDRASEVAAILGDMDAILYDHTKHIFERETAFMLLAAEVETWLRQTESEDMTQILERANEVLAAGIITLSSSGGAFGTRQAAIIDGLRASIEETGLIFEDVAAELRELPEPDFQPLARVSLVEAVWRNKIAHLPQICAAVGIDFFPTVRGSGVPGRARETRPQISRLSKLEEQKSGVRPLGLTPFSFQGGFVYGSFICGVVRFTGFCRGHDHDRVLGHDARACRRHALCKGDWLSPQRYS